MWEQHDDATDTRLPTESTSDYHHYVTFALPDLPDHTLRVRQTDSGLNDYCEGAGNGYTGYLSVERGTKHFYFAYFESRNDPMNDPLVMWINGGPGCSSTTGWLMELGSCRVKLDGSGTTKNDYAWTEAASIVFLDQPVGVGFSYAEPGAEVDRTEAAAEDILAFWRLWYRAFPRHQQLPLHFAGESYAGKYIPTFAAHIIEENELAIKQSRNKDLIPLASVLIGNGIYDNLHQATSAWDIACTNVTGSGPVLNETVCSTMETKVARCEYLLKAAETFPDSYIGGAAADFCDEAFMQPYVDANLNPYDVTKRCKGELCYEIEDAISTYLNKPEVRKAFGVSKHVKHFTGCSNKVFQGFYKSGDPYIASAPLVASILDSGLRVLNYVGTLDWICNFVGNERFLNALPWSGQAGYRHQAANNQTAWSGGLTWQYKNLVYTRIWGAGHMVPYDQPEASLKMVKQWLAEKPFNG
ncbi:carboxypeptidase Y [Protomyces lactucae-debilis]|uniref:carboxypeptidase C n=1 Tax=Protomyces lactucae-debilis TaxID=2754530 RepID=A0A1Y2FIT5_PROLT|nr:carboxypeptidase Y [Protomyces lactucae-debilis]ORY83858.1 carboxypeptidase Y [Protomyces lactucae-debilis]